MSIDSFLASLTPSLAPRTLRAYGNDLRQYESWLGGPRLLARSTVDDAQAYVDHLQAIGRRPTSVRRSASAISRYLKANGKTIARGWIEQPKVEPGVAFGRALTVRQVAGLRSAVSGETPSDARNTAMVEMLYGLGLRVSELVGLDISDVSLKQNVIRPLGKHGAYRVVPIGGSALDALDTWLSSRSEFARLKGFSPRASTALFVNRDGDRITRQAVSRMIATTAQRAKVKGTTAPHMIRDTCARHMISGGASREDVDSLFGHIATIGTHKATWDEVHRLREVLERTHPSWR